MSDYRAPLADMRFVLNELAGLEQVAALPGFEEATPDVADAILDEAAKFADRGDVAAQHGRRSRRIASGATTAAS